MRTLFLLTLPSVALAFDSANENLEFEASQELFRGEDATAYFPSADSTLAIKFSADTRTEVQLNIAATSQLNWPDAMGHTLAGKTTGGEGVYIVESTLAAEVHVNAFGQVIDVPVWSEAFSWTAFHVFDGLLLPEDAVREAWLTMPADANFFQIDTELELAEGIILTFGLQGSPTGFAKVTGESVVANGESATVASSTVMLGMNDINRGDYMVDAVWNGQIDSAWGAQLMPYVEVDLDNLGSLMIPLYTFDWDLGTDSQPIVSRVVEVEHAIPAIDTFTVLDLGDVDVGDVAEREFDIDNLGAMTLTGSAVLQGDAVFDVIDRSFSANADGTTSITVSFEPTDEGDFEGTLILRSNDPAQPTIEVPVIGTAVAVIPDTPEVDPGGDEFSRIRGCGCTSTAGMSGAPTAFFTLGLFALLGLRRRD
ncbi:MAG: MYXO-CTERM domain-containing protein [Myxococcota bacterium]|jgi:MYXO-CTERM domain-containing protein